jgi:hypothetical protein
LGALQDFLRNKDLTITRQLWIGLHPQQIAQLD